MKSVFIFYAILIGQSVMANVNCNIYHVMSDVDGRNDLTEKILRKFETKGYKITSIEKPSDIKDQGKVSYMTVFSDIHHSIGARTSISLVDLQIQGSTVLSSSKIKIQIVKNPVFGSAEKALLNAVEKSIPPCVP